MNQVATVSQDAGTIIESVIVKGDLGKLTPEQRSHYYVEVCKSVGLNPLTQPFAYITLNGKLTLYALRTCTDQLRTIHNVSVIDLTETERDGVFIVTAKVQNGEGRADMAKGAVTINGLKGDALANALMKAETKAKRRATLSICGLGFLDESEVETIPQEVTNGKPPKRTMAEISANKARKTREYEAVVEDLAQIDNLAGLERYKREHLTAEFMASMGNAQYYVEQAYGAREAELSEPTQRDELTEDTGDEPATRPDYIRYCHAIIAKAEKSNELRAWWAGEAMPRRRFSLSQDEVDDLKLRVTERINELTNPLAAG